MKKNFICLMGLAAFTLFAPSPLQAANSPLNPAAAQAAKQVKGRVVDAKGEPVIGARIQVVENGTLGITDAEGEFTINADQGQTLRISCIGYKTRDVKIGRGAVSVVLQEDTKLMDDLVVVGYGSMQRKDVTSSITTVKAEDLNKGVFTDPGQMLQGKVPGLVVTGNGDPNGAPQITLRGASSLRGEAMSPYYVIDGIPGVDIAMVAPEDIESIDVLRDATATAIYGSKAANGVIMITTKKGKDGSANVSYNGYAGFDFISNKLEMLNAEELLSLSRYGINVDDNGGNLDWQKEVLRTGISHNHNVSINGGQGKTSYLASVTYNKIEGIIRNTDRTRLNIRTLVSSSILKDHLDLSLGANLVYGKHEGVAMNWHGESVIDAMNYYSPLNPKYNEDGSYFRVNANPDKNYNPLSMLNEDTSANNMKRQQLTAKATLHIVKGLDWTANYSFNNNQRTNSTYYTHNSQVLPSKYNGKATRSTWWGEEHNFETFGNYNHTWNDQHKLSLMAGYSWEETVRGDGFGVSVNNFYDDYVLWNNLTYGSQVFDGIKGVQSGVKETVRNISFYGRVNYSFDSRYILQATVRRDGSSVFGKNNQWGTFPSFSAAWNISEEKFMQNQKALSTLKFRVGYGISGNAMGFGAYSAVATFGPDLNAPFNYTDENGNVSTYYSIIATKNANPDLKWESTGMFNIGFDYGFLKDRINGTIEFYNKKTNDLIWDYPVKNMPYGYMKANVGEITNRGVEFTINADVIQKKNFRWNTSVNLSHNMNRVDRLSNDTYKLNDFFQGDPDVAGVAAHGYTQNVVEGESLGTFYLYEFAGFENGRGMYYEHDAETGDRTGNLITASELKTDRDRVLAGCAQPKLTLGWNNTFTWKNFTASAFFTGVFGNKIYNGTRANNLAAVRLSGASGTKNVMKDFLTEQIVDGKVITDPNMPSTRFLENGSYFRLQSLSLAYTFRDCFNGWIKDLQLYANGNNLFTITGYKGIDPEIRMSGIDPGVDYSWNIYPHTRSVMVGVKINFGASKKKASGKSAVVEVVREVPVETVKEVVKENSSVAEKTHIVTFALNSAEIANPAELQNIPAGSTVEIVAYASPEGNAEYNMNLSQRRANAVADYLKAKGIKVVSATAKGADSEHSNRIAIVTVK